MKKDSIRSTARPYAAGGLGRPRTGPGARPLFILALVFSICARSARSSDLEENLPFYFAVPESAFLRFDASSPAADRFRIVRIRGHESAPAGLRLFEVDRTDRDAEEVSRRLVTEGIVQSGDIVLTLRPEWIDSSPYQHVQMGLSHSGVIFVEDGVAYNVDMPLDEKFNGARISSALGAKHYREAKALHIMRPRNFGPERARNLGAWVGLLRENLPRIREHRMLMFNVLYTDPNFGGDTELAFVRALAQIINGEADEQARVRMFCSEFVWSLLSLSNVDPDRADFSRIAKILEPMEMFSRGLDAPRRVRTAGLLEGPLMILDLIDLGAAAKLRLVDEMFAEGSVERASYGHRMAAMKVRGLLEAARPYYRARVAGESRFEVEDSDGETSSVTHGQLAARLRRATSPNYPPAAFLINSFLPEENLHRKFDYVGTLYFE